MNYWPLLGVLIVVVGFVLRYNPVIVVVVAGLGNLPGVILAGLGLGAAETTAGFILGVQFQVAFVFCLLVAILVLRNTMLGRKRRYLK